MAVDGLVGVELRQVVAHAPEDRLLVGPCRVIGTPAVDDGVHAVEAQGDIPPQQFDGGTQAVLHIGELCEDLIASLDVPDLTHPDGGLHVLDVQGIAVAGTAK